MPRTYAWLKHSSSQAASAPAFTKACIRVRTSSRQAHTKRCSGRRRAANVKYKDGAVSSETSNICIWDCFCPWLS